MGPGPRHMPRLKAPSPPRPQPSTLWTPAPAPGSGRDTKRGWARDLKRERRARKCLGAKWSYCVRQVDYLKHKNVVQQFRADYLGCKNVVQTFRATCRSKCRAIFRAKYRATFRANCRATISRKISSMGGPGIYSIYFSEESKP